MRHVIARFSEGCLQIGEKKSKGCLQSCLGRRKERSAVVSISIFMAKM